MTPSLERDAPESDRDPVELLAEEFAERLRKGEAPTVEEYAGRHPRLAPRIRRILRPIAVLEQAGRKGDGSGSNSSQPSEEPAAELPSIQGYLIIREIGRGGMGVVYEAEQISLTRRVALKVLDKAACRTPKQLERFRREAEAAARLHHTNIVPVFGAGESEGLAYYVMQLIEGVSLREVLGPLGEMDRRCRDPGRRGEGGVRRRFSPASESAAALLLKCSDRGLLQPGPGEELLANRPEYWRRVAKVGASMARALEHSHQQGILHRDIKPSNIMLDRKGTVWVTDFGLAKHLDREDLTATGDVVGTMRYMAPEQFHGKADARSDIHGLGLTLHELLTLRPAFGERKHGALMKRKLESAPPLPRSIVPHVPADLETIVRKACAQEPGYRYQRAADLEDDLRRFLEDRPISARRIGAPEQIWRWAKRNPVVATLGTAAIVLLIATVLIFAIASHRTREALDQVGEEKQRVEEALEKVEEERERAVAAVALAEHESSRAEQALGQVEEEREKALAAAALAKNESSRAEENLEVALEAFDRILRNLSSRGASGSLDLVLFREVSSVTPADVDLLETLLGFFERFAEKNEVDLAAESASALTQVGDIQRRLGRLTEAIDNYRKALDAYRRLDAREETDTHVLDRARILNAIATTESRGGVIRGAFGTYREARSLLEKSPRAGEPAYRLELARNLVLSATVGERTRMQPSGRPSGGRFGKGRGGPGRRGSGRRGATRRNGDGGSAQRDSSQRAIELLTALVKEDPVSTEYRFLLVRAYRAHALAAEASNDLATAGSSLDAGILHLEKLAEEHPTVPAFQYELADTLCTRIREAEEFERRVGRAAKICERLIVSHPEMPEFQYLAGCCLAERGGLLVEAGDGGEAAAEYERALAHLRASADRFPHVLLLQGTCAETLADLASVRAGLGEPDAAANLLDEAIRRVEEFRDQSQTTRPVLASLLSDLRRQRGELPAR